MSSSIKPPTSLCDPHSGLPLADYSSLPQECHTSFQKLFERDAGLAAVHFLAEVWKYNKNMVMQRRILCLSKDALYICTPKAQVLRCSELRHVTAVYTTQGTTVALQMPDEYDLMVRITSANRQTESVCAGYLLHVLRRLTNPETVFHQDQAFDSLKARLVLHRPKKGWVPVAPLPIPVVPWRSLVLLPGFEEVLRRLHPSRADIVRLEWEQLLAEGVEQVKDEGSHPSSSPPPPPPPAPAVEEHHHHHHHHHQHQHQYHDPQHPSPLLPPVASPSDDVSSTPLFALHPQPSADASVQTSADAVTPPQLPAPGCKWSPSHVAAEMASVASPPLPSPPPPLRVPLPHKTHIVDAGRSPLLPPRTMSPALPLSPSPLQAEFEDEGTEKLSDDLLRIAEMVVEASTVHPPALLSPGARLAVETGEGKEAGGEEKEEGNQEPPNPVLFYEEKTTASVHPGALVPPPLTPPNPARTFWERGETSGRVITRSGSRPLLPPPSPPPQPPRFRNPEISRLAGVLSEATEGGREKKLLAKLLQKTAAALGAEEEVERHRDRVRRLQPAAAAPVVDPRLDDLCEGQRRQAEALQQVCEKLDALLQRKLDKKETEEEHSSPASRLRLRPASHSPPPKARLSPPRRHPRASPVFGPYSVYRGPTYHGDGNKPRFI